MLLLNIPAGREMFSYVIDTKFIRYSIGLLKKLALSVEEKADISLRVFFTGLPYN